MQDTRRGIKQRTLAGVVMLLLGLGTMLVGFGSVTAASADDHQATEHCPAGWAAKYDNAGTLVEGTDQGVTVTVSADKKSVTFSESVRFCIKASTGQSGQLGPASSGSVTWLNPGNQTPEISYIVIYDEGPTTPTSTPTTATSTPTTAATTITVSPTQSTAATTPATSITVNPSESSRPPSNPGDPNNPNDPGPKADDEPEVLGIAKKAPAPVAAAPTAVDAGLTGEESGSSTLWILLGAALAIAGVALGFVPAPSRGKRSV